MTVIFLALSLPTRENKTLWLKETESNKKKMCGQSDNKVVSLLPAVPLRPALASLGTQVGIFFEQTIIYFVMIHFVDKSNFILSDKKTRCKSLQ